MPKHKAGRRLRVLFVTAWYPNADDPVEGVFVREHATAVSGLHDVTVAVMKVVEGAPARSSEVVRETFEGLPTIRFSQGKGRIPKARYIIRLAGQVSFLRSVIAETSPDIIHATVYETAVPAVIAARAQGIPVVLTEHWSGFYRGTVRGVELLKARWGLARTARVMPVCRFLLEKMQKHRINARWEIIPCAINTALFTAPKSAHQFGDAPSAITVASFVPIKGIRFLIEALALLRDDGIHLEHHLVGDGPDRSALERQCRELGLEQSVTFHGRLHKPQLAALMAEMDFLVSSSLGENFATAVVEGMAAGLPVVATSVGAVPEMVDESHGILIPAADALALKEGMKRMALTSDRYDRMAISGWVRERFNFEAVAQQFDRVYWEVLAERRGGTRRPKHQEGL